MYIPSNLLPWTKKKEPSSRFAARKTLFHVWYHARSGAISAGQVRSATVRDFCPALIAPDRAWYQTWNSVLLAANLDDGSFFFVQGSRCRCYHPGYKSGCATLLPLDNASWQPFLSDQLRPTSGNYLADKSFHLHSRWAKVAGGVGTRSSLTYGDEMSQRKTTPVVQKVIEPRERGSLLQQNQTREMKTHTQWKQDHGLQQVETLISSKDQHLKNVKKKMRSVGGKRERERGGGGGGSSPV